ncbi:MAG: hypothetical protein A3I44_03515 [Candidatus Sungbacteria bacterium RIFCSPLOWO2_02_FULL_51_17]|uniref:Glycosyl transferase family 1 n=1 Tax=Candidatus Sungbacteria bacterium RIFCSPHIGHO2_02_FULL_51_29 TaxID=1802273 RepID=A0A1G2KUJ1_9BACT|nr:MAG: hypothetical protein A2676_01390 [Candidatus Sungbacteria bacterium RIFCSPHIGHO2_01_FULL_51_22]OHA02101.1 MAG: hypothetical protein A3C16_04795 [Candidatus Sungbacteria bacterium RIFCSPHIGHO2_02_FULL_51_29]OHA06139.1 MAG: hypothetical protein A3B29_01725 [Candidatus Sungbacteria bacterium RIFCSPLOWO2_01_FULL_51_34]OHA10457.1 MAG: hypothetical protein A3I44_03515 [Candidatus Sungbacteria bacterium RIFCSPLOWO2_02_FULL_51_17]
MQKKKILFVITKSNWGGAQRYVYDLAVSLPRDRTEVAVACGGDGSLVQKLTARGIRVVPIPHLQRNISIAKEMRSLVALWRIFKREKPNVVHLNSSKAGCLGALAARIAGIPLIVFTAHGWAFSEDRFIGTKGVIWLLSWLTALWAHCIIVITEHDSLCRYFFAIPKKKFSYIPNGIDLNDAMILDRASARAELGLALPDDAVLAGTITEYIPNKGIAYLIDAMALVPERISAVLIGGGEEEAAMRRRAAETSAAKRITFAGFRPDAVRFLKAFDMFIFPSLKEGLPYALLEAGLAELPVIASRVGGIPDIIIDGKNGILLEPKNAAALAVKMTLLLRDTELRARLAKNLHHHIMDRFSKDLMVKKTADLYGI